MALPGVATIKLTLQYFNGKQWSDPIEYDTGFIPDIEAFTRDKILDMVTNSLHTAFILMENAEKVDNA